MKKFCILILALCSVLQAETILIKTFKVSGVQPWDPESIKTGIAGSEEAVIYISTELVKLGHDVVILGDPPAGSPYSLPQANPRYISAETPLNHRFDIAIAWRDPYAAKTLKAQAEKVYLWPHDTFSYSIGTSEIEGFADILWLTDWQRQQWTQTHPAFGKYTHIFGNGILEDQFKPLQPRKNPHSLIYGSNYARGLEHLLNSWPEIKKAYPDATLDIYYGWQTWGLLTPEKEKRMREQIASYKDQGVTDHGKVGHEELNRAYEAASIWAYPCTAPETFCITALRAQLAGAIPVILEGTALPETVRFGYKTKNLNEYPALLIKAMKEAETATLESRQKMGDFIRKEFTWKAVAQKWDALFRNRE